MKARRLAMLLLPLVLLIAGCATLVVPAPDTGELEALLARRTAALLAGDQRAYLDTVNPGDQTLLREERNLIDAAPAGSVERYSLQAEDIYATEEGLAGMLVQRSLIDGRARTCRYPVRFVRRENELLWAGPAFETIASDRVQVDYLGDNEALAQTLLALEGEVLDEMARRLGAVPSGLTQIRLYDDHQTFLQSVKLNLPEWVGGWHEYGEAIKTYSGGYGNDANAFRAMLRHETTHKLVSELSGDNAAYWLQEGLASCFEGALSQEPDIALLSSVDPDVQPIAYIDLKAIDLEKLNPYDTGIDDYYRSSELYSAFLLDCYGWQGMQQLFTHMSRSPLIERSAAEKRLETNTRTDEALAACFGLDNAAFQKEFRRWREKNG